MIETDPVHEIERALAEEISQTARRVMRWTPTDVQVHLRDDTIVYLLEGDGMPGPDPDLIEAMERGVQDAVHRTLDRTIAPPIGRTRVSPRTLLVVIRLA